MPDTLPQPGTRPDREDVLVALRRLVAERADPPPPLRLGEGHTARPAALPGPAPLVLTAAQRIPPRPEATGLDDDALRALVARAVRDALRGDLGAHLTRRIRRLVREEIDLALQSRSIDR